MSNDLFIIRADKSNFKAVRHFWHLQCRIFRGDRRYCQRIGDILRSDLIDRRDIKRLFINAHFKERYGRIIDHLAITVFCRAEELIDHDPDPACRDRLIQIDPLREYGGEAQVFDVDPFFALKHFDMICSGIQSFPFEDH